MTTRSDDGNGPTDPTDPTAEVLDTDADINADEELVDDLDATDADDTDADDTDADEDAGTEDDADENTEDEDTEDDDATTSAATAADRPGGSRRRGRLVAALVLVLVATMTALGVVFVVAAGRADDGDGGNRALIDQTATTQVIGEVSQALNTVLSYDYTKPDATEQAASQLLVGDAQAQYKTLFAALEQKAPGQQLTLTAKTVSAAVSALTDDTAQLLVFLNQTSTRASDKSTSSSAAQLQIAAVRSGDSWKISELQPL